MALVPIIRAHELRKVYAVADKQPGLRGTLRHFARRRYRQVEAVKGVSFAIEPGEIVGFLGPNGAGKTTALKMLTGLIHPTSGTLEVAGHLPFARRRDFLMQITLVMGQKQQLIWDLPAMDSLRINAAVYRIAPDEAQRRIVEMAAMLSLDKELTQPVRKLSLGERMKAELMAALLHRPSVLFLDEPTLGLDVNAQAAVRNFLRDYNQRYHATILLTSHYMADITALCPRVVLIHQGSLFYDGSLEGIRRRFSPYREIIAQLKTPPVLAPEQLAAWGETVAIEGRRIRLLVQRDDLPRVMAECLAAWDVEDLTVADPPIEDIVGKLFKTGTVESQPPARDVPSDIAGS